MKILDDDTKDLLRDAVTAIKQIAHAAKAFTGESYTLEDLRATETRHYAVHDGYCGCRPGRQIYTITHIIDVLRDNV